MNARELLKGNSKPVVIVHYKADAALYDGGQAPQNPAVLLQVTLDKENISPSGKLIRLGNTRGDEINGWTKLDAIEVVEILGDLQADNVTVIRAA